jgi:hypothetical protein
MDFDIRTVLGDMLSAVRGVVASEFPKVRECVKKALAEEQAFLEELAKARLDGEIDDDILAQQLHDEKATLEASLLVCRVLTKKLAQDAANAAIDVFNGAIQAALGSLLGPVAGVLVGAPTATSRRRANNGRSNGRAKNARATTTRASARKTPPRKLKASQRRLTARPDTVDFRDLMYVPTLIEVGTCLALEGYKQLEVPILDQGTEGACTGFGLATVAHYLLRKRRVVPDSAEVSPRMLYALARRYDEWPGQDYEGSSCRGAMKGWHKHGVCAEPLWKHNPAKPDFTLTDARSRDAQFRPLGAYFRVNHKDLVAMHAAICEVGVLYASASVHSGWDEVDEKGIIPFDDDVKMLGGHAFAIVAYDEKGYWIQNSWGKDWGNEGFARISYQDWMRNGTDVWVARLGVPIDAAARDAATAVAFSISSRAKAYAYDEVRPHVVSLGNDGQLRPNGNIGTTHEAVRRIFRDDFPRITKGWTKRRLVLYAHGGLVSEDSAVQRVADYRKAMLDVECYPVAFVWRSDYWTTLTNMLTEALRLRKPEGAIDSAKDFMLERFDDALEPLARKLTGKASWDEMKENALAATASRTGGARLALEEVARLVANDPKVELHLVGHSAGSIFHANVVRHLTDPAGAGGLGLTIQTCTLWAPACTMALFEGSYVPAIRDERIREFALYTLTDDSERDDHCARIYNKSLLYLVSNAFERRPRIPIMRPAGEPILGMARFVQESSLIRKLLADKRMEWVKAPNAVPPTERDASRATAHGGFDDDRPTVTSTLARIRGTAKASKQASESLQFRPGAGRIRSSRVDLDEAAGVTRS